MININGTTGRKGVQLIKILDSFILSISASAASPSITRTHLSLLEAQRLEIRTCRAAYAVTLIVPDGWKLGLRIGDWGLGIEEGVRSLRLRRDGRGEMQITWIGTAPR